MYRYGTVRYGTHSTAPYGTVPVRKYHNVVATEAHRTVPSGTVQRSARQYLTSHTRNIDEEQGAIQRCYGEEILLLPLKRDLLLPQQNLEGVFCQSNGGCECYSDRCEL